MLPCRRRSPESGFSIIATTNWAETDGLGFANFDPK
jgi:hypothetical protein